MLNKIQKLAMRGDAGRRLNQFMIEEFPENSITVSEAVKIVYSYEKEYYSLICEPLSNKGNAITLFAFILYKLSIDHNSLSQDVKTKIKIQLNSLISWIETKQLSSKDNITIVGGLTVTQHDFSVLKRIQSLYQAITA